MIKGQTDKRLSVVQAATVTAAATAAANIDCLGADYAEISVEVALPATATVASGDGTTISVLSSDNTNSSTFATVSANRTGIKVSQTVHYLIDTKTAKRYLRVAVAPGTSGVSNETGIIAVRARLGRLEQNPGSTSEMISGNTNDAVVIVTA